MLNHNLFRVPLLQEKKQDEDNEDCRDAEHLNELQIKKLQLELKIKHVKQHTDELNKK